LFDKLTSVNNAESDNNLPLIYPNPAQDYVDIEFNESCKGSLTIIISNNLGQIIKRENLNQAFTRTLHLEINDLQAGIYTVHLKCENRRYSQRLVVQRNY